MTLELDMALLAADAYRDIRALDLNRAPIPVGRSELSQYANGAVVAFDFVGADTLTHMAACQGRRG
jgi:hypothetical protein